MRAVTHNIGRHHAGRLVLAGAAVALAAAACGSSSPSSSGTTTTQGSTTTTQAVACATGSISGAGSTFVQNLAQQWIKDYGTRCPGATVNYQGVGSGAGVTQFTAGTVDFGATDVPLTSAQTAALQPKGATVQVPWASGGIALEYNLSGVTNLQLSANTVAGIFAGTIKTWNDPAIKTDNPSATLPSTAISTVHRSDSSGTTGAFTAYLTAAAPSVWKLGSSKTINWPNGQGAKGSDGVTATVKQTSGAIGYAEVSFAVGAQLPMAKVKNASGSFVSPQNPSAVSAALSAATANPDGSVSINYNASDPAAYPISTVTYVVVFQKPADAAKAKLLKDFLLYAVGPGQAQASPLYYAPLPSSLAQSSMTAINGMQA